MNHQKLNIEAVSEIEVKKRNKTGKAEAGRLRRNGMLPGVLYNKSGRAIPIFISLSVFKNALKTKWRNNTILKLKADGDGELNDKIAILKDFQLDRATDKPLHIDLYELIPGEVIKVQVPIVINGVSSGVKKGGVMEWIKRSLLIKCLPEKIPSEISVDVSNLEIGQTIHIRDIIFEKDIEVIGDKDQPVVTIVAPYEEKVEAAPAVAEEKKEEEGKVETEEGEEKSTDKKEK